MIELALTANLAVRLAVELATLTALTWAGARMPAPAVVRGIAAVGLPLAGAVAWALFAAPDATFALPPLGRIAVQSTVIGSAVTALIVGLRPRLGAALGTVAMGNALLMQVAGQ
jgi:hypothetical protein